MRRWFARLSVRLSVAIGVVAALPTVVVADCLGEGCDGTPDQGNPLPALIVIGVLVLVASAMAIAEARRR